METRPFEHRDGFELVLTWKVDVPPKPSRPILVLPEKFKGLDGPDHETVVETIENPSPATIAMYRRLMERDL